MDPLKKIDQEYKKVIAGGKNDFLAKHLELMLASVKREIVTFDKVPSLANAPIKDAVLKTSSPELITIPSFLLPSIKDALKNNRQIVKSEGEVVRREAVRAFNLKEDIQNEAEKKDDKKKVVSARKAKKRLTLEQERLALKQDARAHLDIKEVCSIKSDDAIIASVDVSVLSRLKGYFMSHYQDSKSHDKTIKRIKSAKISDGLEEAEHSRIRENSIKSMIEALKREDAITTRSSGVRITH